MFIWWGPHLLQFYNDAFRKSHGPGCDPQALGQPGFGCWGGPPEVIGPEIAEVMLGHGAVWHEDYSLSPIEDEQKVHGVLAICSDITVQQTYHALFSSTDQAFSVLEPMRAADGSIIDFRYLEANPAFERHMGVTDPTGRSVRAVFPPVEEEWIEDISEVAKSGQALHRQRKLSCVGRWFDHDLFPIGAPGTLIGMLSRDITAQKENEALLNTILEVAPVAIGVADQDGAITRVNEEIRRIWGRVLPMSKTVEEYGEWKGWFARGTPRAGQLLAPEEWPLARAVRGEELARELVEIETFDDPPQRKSILTSAAPIRDEAGKPRGAVVALMDVSDRVAAEEELRQAHKRKDDFLTVLAHEMRNPLAPISAAAELLRIAFADNQAIQHTSAVLARQVAHMTELLDDLLDISRVSRGLVTLELAELDAKHYVAMAAEQAHPLLEARHHTLTVQCSPEPAIVKADKRRLLQILANLLNNAAKYTPEHGRIEVRIDVLEEEIRITVSDNGIGMTPEFLEQAFDMFSQAGHQLLPAQSGVGIGLALVRKLTELQGGTVHAASDGLDKGCALTLSLPRVKAGGAPPSPRPPVANAPCIPAARSLLLADDNTDAAEMLATLLRTAGHEVAVVHTARDAIAYSAHHQPDAWLLNIGLPDMDGYELARRLRASGERRMLIAITGFGQTSEVSQAFQAGFDYHFVKPIPIERLCELLAYGHLRVEHSA
ncbi:hybrid sensor histidine kinase/response regulator [Pseudoduganella sp. OTU4001]|uniref:hybrid sensor histidine kinase/response regulator n=1 Tax=Pseudoduganella sp. OTU4001 TaxID=3043854 RepID=UPI00313AFE6F